MNNSKTNIKMIAISAVLLALSTALSLVKVWEMPLGGSITLFSMLPVCLIGILYGTKYAVLPCLLFGGIQMFLGNPFAWGLTPVILAGCIIFDYFLAFGVLCTSGIMRKKGTKGTVIGITVACLLRFVCHFISGWVFFANLEQFEIFGKAFIGKPILYSVAYNAFYMVPELIITVIGAYILEKAGVIKRIKNMTANR